MKLFIYLFRQSPGLIVLTMLASTAAGVSYATLVALLNANVTAAIAPRALLQFVALLCVVPVAGFISRFMMGLLAQRSAARLRERLCEEILAAPLREVERIGSSRLTAGLADDVLAITTALGSVPNLCTGMVIVVCSLGYIAWLSPTVFGLVAIALVLQSTTFRLIHNRGLSGLRAAREVRDRLFQAYRELTDGAKELKLHQRRRAAFVTGTLQPISEALMRHTLRGGATFMLGVGIVQFLMFSLMGLLVFAPRALSLDADTTVKCLLMVFYVALHFDLLFAAPGAFGRANVALANITSMGGSLARSPQDSGRAPALPVEWRTIALEEISFRYDDDRDEASFALGPLNLTIHRNEILFLVGGNGSGKTTVAKVVTGLYTPSAGRVSVDNREIGSAERDGYRQMFSAVFADFFLFDRLLGLEQQRLDERARQYLTGLQLESHVRIENGRLSTVNLSQGQRKRLALLTAYLEDRPVYLFDEWAADQDPHFRDIFYRRLIPELKRAGKTVIVITHDDRYYHLADRVVKLECGRVAAETPLANAQVATA